MGQSYLEKTPIEVANLRTNFKFLKLSGKIIDVMNLVYMTHGTETITPMPIDMFAWNYVVYKHYNDRIYDGDNFTTPFNKNISDTTKCLKHK
jgi:hypothetical protein